MTQPSFGPELQRDVQRLLGRCLLRLQQYERLMKTLITHQELRFTPDDMQARLEARADSYAVKTLGMLVNDLLDSYIVPEGTDEQVLPVASGPADRISMAFRIQIEMTPERRAEVKAAIKELVDMRNELVHHLIERFDVWTDAGCVAAISHLNACYDRINRHFEELQHWARHVTEAAADMATFAKSGGFEDALINEIVLDGTFEWPNTGIVRVLRAALDVHAADGWGRLDDATAWIAQHLSRRPRSTAAGLGRRCSTNPGASSSSTSRVTTSGRSRGTGRDSWSQEQPYSRAIEASIGRPRRCHLRPT